MGGAFPIGFTQMAMKGTPLAMNGHDCHLFESPVSEKVIQIGIFGNR
jgi:hypothetical protein